MNKGVPTALKRKRWPISLRLTLWNTIILAALLGFLALAVAGWMDSVSNDAVAQNVGVDLATAAAQLAASSQAGQPNKLGPVRDGAFVQLLDDKNQVVAQTDAWPAGLPLPDVDTAPGTQKTGDYAPYALGTQPVADGYRLVVARDISDVVKGLKFLRSILFWVTAGGTLVAGAVGYLMARLSLRPVEAMVRTARSIGDNVQAGLQARMPVNRSGDELQRLTDTFNDMLQKVEAAFEAQSRFVSDASHELRTPVTVISGYANLLRRWGRSDPAVLDEAIDAITRETERMSSMLSNLLLLARGEQLQIQRQPVALQPLLTAVAQEGEVLVAARAEARLDGHGEAQVPLRVTADCPADLQALGDGHYLKQVLLALVDNAVRHTPPGGQVTLRAQRFAAAGQSEPPWIMITVADTGTGIPPEHLPHIFERFYRVDPDRSRTAGGAGLGLAIVRWLVELNEGTISVSSEVGHGTTFSIRLASP